MNEPLVINDRITIPAEELRFTFVRSAGPGGQNVNKVNTKAVLRWRVVDSPSLHTALRERFLTRFGNRVTQTGELVLSSDEHRQRARNVSACRERLRAMLLSVAEPPRRRRPTRKPRGAVEKRLENKRRQSQKKQDRRRPLDG